MNPALYFGIFGRECDGHQLFNLEGVDERRLLVAVRNPIVTDILLQGNGNLRAEYPRVFPPYDFITMIDRTAGGYRMIPDQEEYNTNLRDLIYYLTHMDMRVIYRDLTYGNDLTGWVARQLIPRGPPRDATCYGVFGHYPSMQYFLYCLLENDMCDYPDADRIINNNLLCIHNQIQNRRLFDFRNALYIDGMNLIQNEPLLNDFVRQGLIRLQVRPLREQRPIDFNFNILVRFFLAQDLNFVITIQDFVWTAWTGRRAINGTIHFEVIRNIMFIVTPSPGTLDRLGFNGFDRKCELDDYILVYLCRLYERWPHGTYILSNDNYRWLINQPRRGRMERPPRGEPFQRIMSDPHSYGPDVGHRRRPIDDRGRGARRAFQGGGKEKIKRTTKKKSLRKNSKRGGKRRPRRTRRTRKISRRTRKSRQSKRRTKKN